MISIEPYNPSWPAAFELLGQELAEVLGELALRIDHIGSTSVPGMAAKDVIDVQVTVAELLPEVLQLLTAAGFGISGELVYDHLPVGETTETDQWTKLFFKQKAGERRATYPCARSRQSQPALPAVVQGLPASAP